MVVVVVRSRPFGVFGVDDGYIKRNAGLLRGHVWAGWRGDFWRVDEDDASNKKSWENLQESHIYLVFW